MSSEQQLESYTVNALKELRSTIADLNKSKEDLEAANVSLLEQNRKLESTNNLLQTRISLLTHASDDTKNLLDSIELGVYLATDLRVRLFTSEEASDLLPALSEMEQANDSRSLDLLNIQFGDKSQDMSRYQMAFEKLATVAEPNEPMHQPELPCASISSVVDGIIKSMEQNIDRKRSEIALRVSEEENRLLVENAPYCIHQIGMDGRLISMNQAGLDMMGAETEQEIIGQRYIDLVSEADLPRIKQLLSAAFQGESSEFEFTASNDLDFASSFIPIQDEHRKVVRLMGLSHDITERLRATEEVKKAVRQRDQFLAMLSHELRNPLAAILTATTLRSEPGICKEDDAEACGIIERSARQLSRLLDELLDMSRFTYDKINLHREPIDLCSIANEIVECVQPTLDQKNHNIEINVSADPIFVDGDIGRLQQAQVNLLINAARYTPNSGNIKYTLRRENDTAIIKVQDNGIGIASEFLRKVFDPFVQCDQALDRTQGGMGLGLPLVKMIVEAHQGEVTANSDGESQGSEFTIRIPTTESRPQVTLKDESNALSGKKMVIVEDNQSIRRMLTMSMELKGFSVTTAVDGIEGLDAITRFGPDVALVDIGLPDLNGYELAKLVRKSPECSHTLLVALTGYGSESDRDKAMNAGFDLHLIKPITPNKLFEKLVPYL